MAHDKGAEKGGVTISGPCQQRRKHTRIVLCYNHAQTAHACHTSYCHRRYLACAIRDTTVEEVKDVIYVNTVSRASDDLRPEDVYNGALARRKGPLCHPHITRLKREEQRQSPQRGSSLKDGGSHVPRRRDTKATTRQRDMKRQLLRRSGLALSLNTPTTSLPMRSSSTPKGKDAHHPALREDGGSNITNACHLSYANDPQSCQRERSLLHGSACIATDFQAPLLCHPRNTQSQSYCRHVNSANSGQISSLWNPPGWWNHSRPQDDGQKVSVDRKSTDKSLQHEQPQLVQYYPEGGESVTYKKRYNGYFPGHFTSSPVRVTFADTEYQETRVLLRPDFC
ncbi:uncharacterized protein B0I36DRAFT_340678 [Microdochium trichocladiopsis]|uniref:Uncharacterized protein n=1 Tax=Microdochium trichocladiopsis TaxID=1682393 RepID=A0A9P8XR04_9PEZI|nr:uncharacterized protein B0I36DRAFT_340678 [Microdochium trichocladiopsis]KAH7012206.1 hypothetical protein B0I36DRAFT_340678 [Microdochium trichocladiopsis]